MTRETHYFWKGLYFPWAGIEDLIQLELCDHALEWIPLIIGYRYVYHTKKSLGLYDFVVVFTQYNLQVNSEVVY